MRKLKSIFNFLYTVILSIEVFKHSDENECTEGTHDCSINAKCTNTDGAFDCECSHGYQGDGFQCQGFMFAVYKKNILYIFVVFKKNLK